MIQHILAILLTLAATATQTQAQQMPACAPHDAQTQILADKYREVLRADMTSVNQSTGVLMVFEFFGNGETGTWTILVTGPDGTACVGAAGHDYRSVESEPRPAGVPA